MAGLIVPTEIPNGAVYGVRQMTYAVDGVSGKDYGAALAAAAFKESVAIEASASAYSEVVRQRENEMLDQTKDLFAQDQKVIDAVVQLMQAVLQAETTSIRDAIQA